MKNQYFGDQRDYFKFDLVINLATYLLPKPRFTNIVMLTPNDGTGNGGVIAYGMGNRSRSLYEFLQRHARLGEARRKVRSLRDYFATKRTDVEYLPYADDTPHFDGGGRSAYFNGIHHEWLEDAVILVDPDVGLLPQSGRKTSCKHILPSEAVALKNHMGSSSVLVLFQWRGQGRRWQDLFDYTQASLQRQGDDGHFAAIYQSNLAFICMTNNTTTRAKVRDCLLHYARANNLQIEER